MIKGQRDNEDSWMG